MALIGNIRPHGIGERRMDLPRETGYYVDRADWPAVPYPEAYPSVDQIYETLQRFDALWENAMIGLAGVEEATPEP
jgi:hypothetical protein